MKIKKCNEILNEAKLITFYIFDGNSIMYQSSAGNAADQVDKKLKQKKFKDKLKSLKVMRTIGSEESDVTNLFIKESVLDEADTEEVADVQEQIEDLVGILNQISKNATKKRFRYRDVHPKIASLKTEIKQLKKIV